MTVSNPKFDTLPSQSSAKRVLSAWQIVILIVIVGSYIIWFYWQGINTLSYLFSFLAFLTSMVYFYSVLVVILAILASKGQLSQTTNNPPRKSDEELPIYTILVPLFKEAEVFNDLITSLLALDYPQHKLDIILLLEADDVETIDVVTSRPLPPCFRLLLIPAGYPRTKPRACNFGLLQAQGEYVVVYDVEDRPEPDQLRKAIHVFRQQGTSLFCVQCRLNYYNVRQNVLTRLFTLEYSFWFDLLLTGLNVLRAPIPLGGTSNHFQTEALRKFGGWDSYNVTEDCDLGIRIALAGYQTLVIDSTTWEEANSQMHNWIRQRSRWVKGYIQTYLVHMRNPARSCHRLGLKNFISFQLVVGGAPLVLLSAPFLWVVTAIAYFRSFDSINLLPLVPYFATFLFFGICGAIVRRNYDLLKYTLLLPGYYALQSFAAWKGLFQLFAKPHYWEKTRHGLLNNVSQSADR
jgi:cellulose synthase/poly-beta-1,6-N-acetylglucosamine synthase-like glycosyltransferase